METPDQIVDRNQKLNQTKKTDLLARKTLHLASQWLSLQWHRTTQAIDPKTNK